LFLVSALVLSGCDSDYSVVPKSRYQSAAPAPMAPGASSSVVTPRAAPLRRVAVLLPLSGQRSDLGHILLQAVQLALAGDETLVLDILDTGGTPSGAVTAARLAIENGDGMFLGPLMSPETAAIAPIARVAGIPVLAFTNDATQAQPGVWPLGISPLQQIRRLVAATVGQGHSHFAALLPDSEFGRVMSEALQTAALEAGLSQPIIQTHMPGMSAVTVAVRDMADYGGRRGPVDARIKALKADPTPEARRQILELQKSPIPPPPFDVLLLADTGDELQEIAAVLPYYDVDRSAVQVLGPSLWSERASGAWALSGAWYAAPDASIREGFAQNYTARFGAAPPVIADVAFDAALIARFVASSGDDYRIALTQSSGFVGTDGLVALSTNGAVHRGLAVFKIDRSGPSQVEPAPNLVGTKGF